MEKISWTDRVKMKYSAAESKGGKERNGTERPTHNTTKED